MSAITREQAAARTGIRAHPTPTEFGDASGDKNVPFGFLRLWPVFFGAKLSLNSRAQNLERDTVHV